MSNTFNQDETFTTAAVLCGGASKRMGFDKSLMPFEEGWLLDAIFEQLLEIFPHVMGIGACAYTRGDFPSERKRSRAVEAALQTGRLQFFKDLEIGLGPMAGLLQAMNHCQSRFIYMTACDMPKISQEHIQRLKNTVAEHPQAEIVVGTVCGRIEPFQAFYHCNLKSKAARLMAQNRLSLKALMDGCAEESLLKVPIVQDAVTIYLNLNNPTDLKNFEDGGLP